MHCKPDYIYIIISNNNARRELKYRRFSITCLTRRLSKFLASDPCLLIITLWWKLKQFNLFTPVTKRQRVA